ncbi:D-alanyl-D-alanine carboxypeptidase family protein (plasmid) [Bacillus sp. 31A1R]|uniref:serine-type D-Ala-D-Ala carboxypeptidase n=1 Tax=Robertmurraya mangrovi TaxID=3098077 RepID=A0ABU5IVI8_9BACI|nr:D-alanyl-D-alanine carboxypeptidase family protein [Bacillus sp. 31A1R]MDZ5471150.1 D-alanyl-D-alanine carboxypeptidase family protein [Bacillus sp. 31A1R]
MNLKLKLIIFSLIVSIIIANFPQKVQASVSVSARNAILIEQETGRILYEKAANEKRRIASITKIMTAIIAIESGKLNDLATVSEKAVRTEGSAIYLKPNEKIKLEDLVYGLMLRSGNDSAVAIAEHVGGSLEGFVYLMNQKAEEIGMKNTNFANPHGLDDSDEHYSTAYDMAILTRYAMMNDTYRKIAGTEVHRAPNPNDKWDRVWRNKNRLLTDLYDYCTGGKTGYTKLAKRTLVTTATKDNMNLIAVTLNGPDDWNDHIFMYEIAFKNYDMVQVLEEGMIPTIKDKIYKNHVFLERNFSYPVTSDERDLFKVEYKLLKPKKEWNDERNVPEVVGNAIVYFEDKEVKKVPIYYKMQEEKPTFMDVFKSMFTLFIGVRPNG